MVRILGITGLSVSGERHLEKGGIEAELTKLRM